MATRKPEYQHFIPQFLLRNFSHKYVPPDLASAGKPKKRGKKNKMYPGEPVINSLCLSDGYRLDECLVRRVCGLENMYVDTAKPAKDQGNLEKKFCAFENRASCVIRKITKAFEDGKSAVSLKRSENDILRKFIFLLAYRGEQYHRKYNFESMLEYDEDDKELLQAYMTKYGFTRPIDVWLKSLDAIIDLHMDAQGNWKKTIFDSTYFPIADSFVSHIGDMYMAICTPANPDEEFVLTDNCYNVSEGQTTFYYDEGLGKHRIMCPGVHKFAPISPRLILVLRHDLLPEPNEDADPAAKEYEYRGPFRRLVIDSLYDSGTRPLFQDLPIRRETNKYRDSTTGRWMSNWDWNQRAGADDEFCFTIFKLRTRHVQRMNGLLIDHAFHGSRIMFNRKDAFLNVMAWYLTEPCEVGKNLTGEHAATQMAYIEELSQFMRREGRALAPHWTFWQNEYLDLKQLHIENLAGARLLVEIERGEMDEDGFDTCYQRLGGAKEAFDADMMMAETMFEIWARCVDLDWGSSAYELLRSKRLNWLLDGYQRQSCVRFWLFLKRTRFALSRRSRVLKAIQDMSLFEREECEGSEDMVAFSYPVIQGRELNVALYKAFKDSMDMRRGPGHGLESMGYFSLFGDPAWKIPTPVAIIGCWPWDKVNAEYEPEVSETLLSWLLENLEKKASTHPPRRKQQFDETEAEKVDMTGLKKAAHSWLFDDEKAEISTDAVEEARLDVEREPQKSPNPLSKAGRWVPAKKDPEWPTYNFMEWQPDDGTEALTSPYADEKVHPARPQPSTHMEPPPRESDQLKRRQAHQKFRSHTKRTMLLKLSYIVLFAAYTLFLVGCCSRALAQLFHLVAAMLRGSSWALEACLPAVDTMTKYLVSLAVGLKLICWLVLGEIGW